MFGYQFPNTAAGFFEAVYRNFKPMNYEIVISSDIPSFIEGPGQINDDAFYEDYDRYIEDDDIVHVFIDDIYVYTVWNNGSFDRHVRNLCFAESVLVWFEKKMPNNSDYLFENKNWDKAIFGYDGGSFYEVFSNDEICIPAEFQYISIEYPGSINGPGGLFVNV